MSSPDAADESEQDEVGGGGGERGHDAADGVDQKRHHQDLPPAHEVCQTAPEVAAHQHSWVKEMLRLTQRY